MALKTTIRLGGVGGSTTWDATLQVPLYEGDGSPLLSAGQRYGQGSACQFQFLIEDRVGEISRVDLTKGVGSHNVVTVSENASGTERWIGRGRVSGVDAGRDGKYWPATKTLTVTVDDGNVDTKGLTLTSTWPRGAESGRARVLAALAAFCNGSPRLTTVISTHLVASGGEVTMPAKDYPAGTELNEIFIDCATVEGKEWGTVIHHDGGSHLCFEYIDDQDHTTYLSTLSISDVPTEVNNTTVFAPHWLQGPAFVADEGDVGHGVVLRWGSAPDQFVVSQDTAYVTSDDYWLNSVNDSLSENASEAALKATQIRLTRTLAHITHQPTLRMKAEFIHLIEAGMSISIKSAAAMGGQYLNTAQTRRIAQAKKEPIAPQLVGGETGWYYVHLQLDRPLNIFQGRGLPPGPIPAGGTVANVKGGAYGSNINPATDGIVIPDGTVNAIILVQLIGTDEFGAPSWSVTYEGSGATAVSGSLNAQSSVIPGRSDHTTTQWFWAPVADNTTGTTRQDTLSYSGAGAQYWGYLIVNDVQLTNPIGSVVQAQGNSQTPAATVSASELTVSGFGAWAVAGTDTTDPTMDAPGTLQWGVNTPTGLGVMDFALGYGDASASFTMAAAAKPWVCTTISINGTGAIPEPIDDSGDVGTDTGMYANADHTHGHGSYSSGDYHTEYVREAILTTAGDLPYATGASTWTRRAIGASNFHLTSDGTQPIWMPQTAGSGMTNPMTSVGDIIKGGTAGTPERLAIGASNTILKSTGTTPEWANTARLSYLDLDVHTPSNPPTPPAGVVRLYGSNSRAFAKNESGTAFDLTETGSGSGGSGGSFTHAYIGYNTVGGSNEAIVNLRQYMKSVTLAADGMLTSIGAYIKQTAAGNIIAMGVSVLDDNAGAPDHTIAHVMGEQVSGGGSTFLSDNNAVAGDARWLHMPIGLWLPAGTYWLAVMFNATAATHDIYYDGSGADRYFTNGGWRITDSGWTAVTTSTNKYSIRGSLLT